MGRRHGVAHGFARPFRRLHRTPYSSRCSRPRRRALMKRSGPNWYRSAGQPTIRRRRSRSATEGARRKRRAAAQRLLAQRLADFQRDAAGAHGVQKAHAERDERHQRRARQSALAGATALRIAGRARVDGACEPQLTTRSMLRRLCSRNSSPHSSVASARSLRDRVSRPRMLRPRARGRARVGGHGDPARARGIAHQAGPCGRGAQSPQGRRTARAEQSWGPEGLDAASLEAVEPWADNSGARASLEVAGQRGRELVTRATDSRSRAAKEWPSSLGCAASSTWPRRSSTSGSWRWRFSVGHPCRVGGLAPRTR